MTTAASRVILPSVLTTEDVIQALSAGQGLISHLGMDLTLEGDQLCCRVTIDDRHQGAPGVAHGGTLTAMLDTALGVQAFRVALARGMRVSTVELKTNFLRPAKVGDRLLATATIQSEGRSLIVASGRAIVEDTDKQVAFAVGTFNVFRGDLSRERDA